MTSLANNFGENIVINPSFELGQRNILFPNITTSQYTLDRWNINLSGGQDVKVERILDAPIWSKNIYSLKLTNNLAVVNGVSSVTSIRQPIEGYNVRRIRGNDFVISFNIKSSIAGIYTIYFSNNGSTVRYNTPITVNQSNVWEHKTVRINAINEILGTFLFDNNIGLDMQLILQSGTGFPNVKDTWTNIAIIGNTGQVDFMATLGSTIQLNDVSIHSGIEEIPFENLIRSFDQEVSLCQRYFEKTYDMETLIGTATNIGIFGLNNVSNGVGNVGFSTEKRIIPIIVFYDTLGSMNFLDSNGGSGNAIFSNLPISKKGFSGGFAGGYSREGHYTADAEL